MKLFTEAFLDKWEARATQRGKGWDKKAPPNWVVALNPDLRLQPTERYTFGLYVRQNLQISFFIILIFLLWLFPFGFIWYKYPFVLHDPKYHKVLIRILSHTEFYFYIWLIPIYLTISGMVTLPRFYFWNRRAERLRREPLLPDAIAAAVAIDASIWPPPPKTPA